MLQLFRRFLHETDGQDLIEYALLAALLAVGTLVAMRSVRNALNTQFSAISTAVAS